MGQRTVLHAARNGRDHGSHDEQDVIPISWRVMQHQREVRAFGTDAAVAYHPMMRRSAKQFARSNAMRRGALLLFLGSLLFASLPLTAALAASGAQTQQAANAFTNRLIDSNDPYLLLHAHNPVDWYPWGPEALARAKQENKPIFVSIGYSTCYWCHVAERTIYSNPEIAKLMNQWFINIKVDRERRPDLDTVSILARTLMTGNGGWPNNVFLPPDLKPFYAGSFFPADDDSSAGPGISTGVPRLHAARAAHPPALPQPAD